MTLTYIIDEGPRFSIRNVSFNGNEKFKVGELNKGLEQVTGKPFNQTTLDHDLTAIRDVYGTHGYIFSDVQRDMRLLEDKPEMDLIYNVNEGKRYRIGKINVNINGDDPHTKHATVYDRMSLHPGDIVDTKKIREDERRLRASSMFNVDPTKGGPPKIAFNKPDSPPDDNDSSVAQRPTSGPGSRPAAASRFGTPFNSNGGSGPAGPGGYGNGYGGGMGSGPGGYGSGGPYDGYRGQSPDDDEVLVDVTCVKDASGNDCIVFTPSEESKGRANDRGGAASSLPKSRIGVWCSNGVGGLQFRLDRLGQADSPQVRLGEFPPAVRPPIIYHRESAAAGGIAVSSPPVS